MMGQARIRAARALVRYASRWMDASYAAHYRVHDLGWPSWYERPWHWASNRVCRVVLPLADRFDKRAAGQQMVEECWWG